MPESWTDPDDPLIGSQAGVYRLVRRLGEGGMGAVYLAERDEGFTRTAALKLLLQGAGHAEMAGRFQVEKQALAALQHPHIVGLLDAGLTAAGIPYLVMEYVEGQPLDKYCGSHGVSLRNRLQLILQMLDAIEFAHARLVAHCDLKFPNVLVNGAGSVRLLDFGIAKLLHPGRYGFADSFTREFRPLTPEFASPEQLSGAPLTISSDIYSAGVLLYGLLTGQHPFEDRLVQPVALLEAVCFEKPKPPSAHAAYAIDPDLDAIVVHALEKNPQDRYPSAAAFAEDLRRYLGGMPVSAHPGTPLHRASKFVRRNRGISAAIAAAVLASGSGIAGTAWESVRATHARNLAEARAGDIRTLSNGLITNLYEKIGRLPGSLGAQQLLVSRGVAYLDRLAADGGAGAGLSLDLARGYTRLAAVQGSPYENNLGRPQDALATLDKASRLTRQSPELYPAKLVRARIHQTRGEVLVGLGRAEAALDEARRSAALADEVAALRPKDPEVLLQCASAHEAIGDKLANAGLASMMDPAGAMKELEHARDLDRRVLALHPADARGQRGIVVLTMKRGDLLQASDPPSALAGYQEAMLEFQKLPAADQESLPNRRLRADLLRRMGDALAQQGRFDEAAQMHEEDIRVLDSMLSIEPDNSRARWDLAVAEHAMAILEDSRDRVPAALKHHENVAALLRLMPDVGTSLQVQTALAEALVEIGSIRAEAGDRAHALAATREGLDLLRKVAQHPDVSNHSLASIAETFLTALPAELQDPPFAWRCLERLGPAPADPAAMMLLAEAHRRLGREKQATETARALLDRLPADSEIHRRAQKFLGR
jgi:tetratricopeptide (TPR) repeat protein